MGYEAVLDGSNAEDMKDFRPGMKAKKEKSVISPLAEAGFTKDDIRQLSRKYNLPTASKQSYACLASRIPYGEDYYQTEAGQTCNIRICCQKTRVSHSSESGVMRISPDLNLFLTK